MKKITLFPHQEEGIAFLKEHKRAILADQMGLGKTKQAIIASNETAERNIIVICPASLKINWEREIKIVDPAAEVFVVRSGPEKEIPDDAKWIVINYDMITKYERQLHDMVELRKVDTAIIDEAHYIKGAKTIRAKQTLELVAKLQRVYCLTGTPIMNRPIELFNMLRAIGHPLGRNRSFFSKRYCGGHLKVIPLRGGRILRFWDESGATRLPELKDLISGYMLRRTKAEVLDLPEKLISVETCELDKEWQKTYDTAWDRYIEWLSNNPEGKNIENVLTAQHLVELTKLKQVCSQAKVKRMVQDIENAVEQGEKVIVFSQYTDTINQFAEQLKKVKIGAVTLTGQHNETQRQKAVDGFQNDDDIKVFIGNMKAAGVGITLTAATIVMFADMDWSPEIHAQAEDRAHRIGQTGTVNVYYYVLENTVEEDIVGILEEKSEIITELMEEKGHTNIFVESMNSAFVSMIKKKLGTSH